MSEDEMEIGVPMGELDEMTQNGHSWLPHSWLPLLVLVFSICKVYHDRRRRSFFGH